jgi:DNA-binding NarL/FixJ family response regulator
LVEVGYATRRPAAALPGEALTERELTVPRLLPSGLSQREIAAGLL